MAVLKALTKTQVGNYHPEHLCKEFFVGTGAQTTRKQKRPSTKGFDLNPQAETKIIGYYRLILTTDNHWRCGRFAINSVKVKEDARMADTTLNGKSLYTPETAYGGIKPEGDDHLYR